VRKDVKAVLEEVLEKEMTEHLKAGDREFTPTRLGKRDGRYTGNLLTPALKFERLQVPRDREGAFVTELLERYQQMTGGVEVAILKMYLCRVFTRTIVSIIEALSRMRIDKDAVNRISARLQEEQKQ